MLLDRKVLLILFAVALIWGINPSVNKILQPYADPFVIIFIRFFISSITLFAYLIYKKEFRLPSVKYFCYYLVLGFFSITGTNTVNIAGLEYSTVTNCSLIISVSPLLISVSAFFLFKEKLFFLQWFGIFVVALSTIYLITGGHITQIFAFEYNRGDLLFLLGQVTWTIYTLMISKPLKGISLVELVAWPCFLGSLINLAISIGVGSFSLPQIDIVSASSFFFAIWVNSMGAVLLWNYGVKQAGSQIASIFINLSTLISVFLGIYLLGEEVTSAVVVGSIGILGGVLLLTQYKLFLYFFQKMRYAVHK